MKHIKLVALLALIIGCSQIGRLEVKSIDIQPQGGVVNSTADTVTASIDFQGTGSACLNWYWCPGDSVREQYSQIIKTEYWHIDTDGIYTSTLWLCNGVSQPVGWFWLTIHDEDFVLLATSDTVLFYYPEPE
ncbi:hypothetical protein KAX06_05635 [candidate division WOR-3 bacterium]|nr:hypothetical protein [candidate division WOR-3 bacterium]